MTAVILAAPSIASEPELVRSAASAGVTVLRRCVDAVDVLAAAAAAPDAAVVVCAGLPRLSADAVDRLARGRTVIGLASDAAAADLLHAVGVERVVLPDPVPAATWRAVVTALVTGPAPDVPTGVWSTGCWIGPEPVGAPAPVDDDDVALTPPAPPPSPARPAPRPRTAARTVVAVWGPQGAPGRTTVAVALADAFADAGRSACIVDADTYAPGVGLALGLDDSVSDLVVACRCAENRSVGPAALAAVSRPVRDRLSAIGGIAHASRWAELRPGALDRLWRACREVFDVTVVDVGFCLEHDPDAGPLDRHRNAAAVSALSAADVVVCVADASDLGAARLAAAWPEVAGLAAGRPTVLARNRSGGRGRAWKRTVALGGAAATVVELPDDPAAVAACWTHGATLSEGARRSRLRRAATALAATCEAVGA